MQTNQTAIKALHVADKAAKGAVKTMTAQCLQAAQTAAAEVTATGVPEQYKEVAAAYADTLKPLDKNVRALFMSFVLCALAPDFKVELQAPTETKPAIIVNAEDVDSKANATKAAKQIREELGMAASNNRKAKTEPAPLVPQSALPAAANVPPGFSFSAWASHLSDVVTDPQRLDSLTKSLRALGYELLTQVAVKKGGKAPKATPVVPGPFAGLDARINAEAAAEAH